MNPEAVEVEKNQRERKSEIYLVVERVPFDSPLIKWILEPVFFRSDNLERELTATGNNN